MIVSVVRLVNRMSRLEDMADAKYFRREVIMSCITRVFFILIFILSLRISIK
jgi:hypothetical protein